MSELNALAEQYYGADANRKPHIYLVEYERILEPLRHSPLRLLELGVKSGASMSIWRDYLPRATIVGLDISEMPESFPDDQRVNFVQGSQDDPAALQRCVDVAGGQFDIVIDDASHIGRLSAASFAFLFLHGLKPGGYYAIEDICTAFLPEFPDSQAFAPAALGYQEGARYFPSHNAGMVGVIKQLFDHVMAPTIIGSYSLFPIERMLILTNISILEKAKSEQPSLPHSASAGASSRAGIEPPGTSTRGWHKLREATKTIARQIPQIDRLVRQRDGLLREIEQLKNEATQARAGDFVVKAQWNWFQKPDVDVFGRFLKRMAETPSLRILEIGSRRVAGRESTTLRRFAHPTSRYIGCDFEDGEDVDIVADAHSLSQTFPPDSFDMVLTIATYEHLSRPWVATNEIAKLLKSGGWLYIRTHQTFPLHGYPEDYFRFSTEALSVLCEDAGLRVVQTTYGYPVSLVSLLDPKGSLAPAYILVEALAEKSQ